jgi:hypothetical protein
MKDFLASCEASTRRVSYSRLKNLCFTILTACALVPLAHSQDCASCVTNSYLQSGLLPDYTLHAAAQFDYRYRHDTLNGSSKAENAADEKIADSTFNAYFSQPLFNRTSLDVNLPLVSRAYTQRPAGTYESGRDTQLGDMSLALVVQPYWGVRGNKTVDWRVRGGVKLPTGDSGELKNLPATLASSSNSASSTPQSAVYAYDRAIGSGSADWIIGSSYVVRYEKYFGIVDAQYIGRTTGENDFRYGDKVTTHVSPGYIFHQFDKDLFAVMLDAAYEFVNQAEYNGSTVENSGQTQFSLGPKLFATFAEHLSATIGIDIPVYRTVEGTQLATNYQLTTSIMYGF